MCVDGKIRALTDPGEHENIHYRQPAVRRVALVGLQFMFHRFDAAGDDKHGEFQVLAVRDHSPTLGWGAVFSQKNGRYYEKVISLIGQDAMTLSFSDSLDTLTIKVQIKGDTAASPLETVELKLPRANATYCSAQSHVMASLKHRSIASGFKKDYKKFEEITAAVRAEWAEKHKTCDELSWKPAVKESMLFDSFMEQIRDAMKGAGGGIHHIDLSSAK